MRLTALPAPTITKVPSSTKAQPRLITSSLKNGNTSEVAIGPLARCDSAVHGDDRDHRLGQQARAAGKAGMALLGDLQIVVIKADQAEAQRHPEHDPHIRAGRVRPQQGRDQQAGEDHQPAHGGRALLGDQMRLRAVGADRLALALLETQQVDHRAAEQEHEHQRGDDGAAGAKRDVTEDVEERDLVGEFGQPIEHRIKSCRSSFSASRSHALAPAPARARPVWRIAVPAP